MVVTRLLHAQKNLHLKQLIHFRVCSAIQARSARSYSSLSDPSEPINSQKKRSFTRFLLKSTILSVFGAAGILYFSKDAREFVKSSSEETEKALNFIDEQIGGFPEIDNPIDYISKFLSKDTKNEKPASVNDDFPKLKPAPKTDIVEKKADPAPHFKMPEIAPLPSFEDIEKAINTRTEQVLKSENLLMEDLKKLASVAETYVEDALQEIKETNRLGKNYVDQIKACLAVSKEDKAWKDLAKYSDLYNQSKSKMSKNINDAKHHLATLWVGTEKSRKNAESMSTKFLQETLKRYKDLQYQLDIAILEAKQLEAEISSAMNQRDSYSFKNIETDLKSIRQQSSKLPKNSMDQSKDYRELNALLLSAYERIELLEKNLQNARIQQQEKIEAELKCQKKRNKDLMNEAIAVELANQRNEFALERLQWEEETKELIEQELDKALARHSDHLTQMLKIKHDEMEHQHQKRVREALIKERSSFENSLRGWKQRMDAIDHVAQGRAQLDRISKEAQAFWISVETLASMIEFPTLDATTPPLNTVFMAIKETAPPSVSLVTELLKRFPKIALEEGVWTSKALKERFDKVYTVCRRVAYMDELDPSMWQYFASWTRSALTFDVNKMGNLWSQFNHFIRRTTPPTPACLIDRETEFDVCDLTDEFKLLDSARLAVDRGDLELALKLMLNLKGHARALADDWCKAVKAHLEIKMISLALLANARATGITAFQERL